jgi:hypothetical protein
MLGLVENAAFGRHFLLGVDFAESLRLRRYI